MIFEYYCHCTTNSQQSLQSNKPKIPFSINNPLDNILNTERPKCIPHNFLLPSNPLSPQREPRHPAHPTHTNTHTREISAQTPRHTDASKTQESKYQYLERNRGSQGNGSYHGIWNANSRHRVDEQSTRGGNDPSYPLELHEYEKHDCLRKSPIGRKKREGKRGWARGREGEVEKEEEREGGKKETRGGQEGSS